MPSAALRPLKQPLYDTMQYAIAGQVQLRMFSVPLGQPIAAAAANKTLADTNLEQAGQLGTPQMFDLYGFCFEAQLITAADGSAGDAFGIYETGVFEFTFGVSRPWLQIPLTEIPRGVGPTGGQQGDGFVAAYAREWLYCGEGSPAEMYSFTIGRKAIRLHSNETFGVNLNWPLGAVAITAITRVRVYLMGILYAAL